MVASTPQLRQLPDGRKQLHRLDQNARRPTAIPAPGNPFATPQIASEATCIQLSQCFKGSLRTRGFEGVLNSGQCRITWIITDYDRWREQCC